jgi:hypothetical protein
MDGVFTYIGLTAVLCGFFWCLQKVYEAWDLERWSGRWLPANGHRDRPNADISQVYAVA